MSACPACNYEGNLPNALVCVRCGKILSAPTDNRDTQMKRHATSILPAELPTLEPRVHKEHIGKLQRQDIALYIQEIENPLIITLKSELLLGRYGGIETEQPAVDLAAFKGFEHGVSRKHALLKRLGPDVAIIDLGSTNGTWLNGIRLQAHQPVTVRNGDRLLVARLPMQIYLV